MILLLLIFLFAGEASAATYWASTTGGASCGSSQSSTDPGPGRYVSIGTGVTCLSSGDTLYVKKGIYATSFGGRRDFSGVCFTPPCIPNGTTGQYTTISAAPGEERQVIMAPTSSHGVEMLGRWRFIRINGFVFDGGAHRQNDSPNPTGVYQSLDGFNGGCAYVNGAEDCGTPDSNLIHSNEAGYITFSNNEIRNWWRQGALGWSGATFVGNDFHHNGSTCDGNAEHNMYIAGNSNIIEGNRIHHPACWNVHNYNQGKNPSRNIIRNNLIYATAQCNINANTECFGPRRGDGIYSIGTGALIYNNVVTEESSAVAGGVVIEFCTNCKILNNTVVGSGVCAVAAQFTENGEIKNNLCSQNGFGNTIDIRNNAGPNLQLSNNYTGATNPQFANPGAPTYNFQLTSSTTTAIRGAGANLSVSFTTDANGVTRSSTWDIGACQWTGTSSPQACPNLAGIVGPPPVPPPSISITGPVSGATYITTTQAQILTGTASCSTGNFVSPAITWVNDRGGTGNATGTISWTFAGSGATLTPYLVNTITVTVNCTGASPPTASSTLQIAYNPAELIGAYSLDENSGTAPQDSSTKKNNASFGAGVAYTSTLQKYGASALDFNGTTGTMTIPSAASLAVVGGFSIVAQVRPDALQTGVALNQAFNKYLYPLTTQACGTNVPMGGFSGVTAHEICGPTPLQQNVYSCLAVTYNGQALALYVNGTQVQSAAKQYELPSVNTAQPVSVGSNPSPASFFNGQLDEIRYYNYGITAGQVVTDCTTPIGVGTPAPASSLKIGSVGVKVGDEELKIGF